MLQPCGRALLLLAGDSLGLALAGASIGVRALTADWQTLTVAKAPDSRPDPSNA